MVVGTTSVVLGRPVVVVTPVVADATTTPPDLSGDVLVDLLFGGTGAVVGSGAKRRGAVYVKRHELFLQSEAT